MRSRSYLFLGVVFGLAILAIVGYKLKDYNWGLDIRGGVELIYQMTDTNGNTLSAKEAAADSEAVTSVLVTRAGKGLGVVDAIVQPKGTDQDIVDLPTYTNVDEAEKIMGSNAQLILYDGKDINTTKAPYRDYDMIPPDTSHPTANPEVDFRRKSDGKVITTADKAEYAKVIAGFVQICNGKDIQGADQLIQGTNYYPQVHLKPSGADKLSAWSSLNNHNGEILAAVLDGVCISAGPVEDGQVLSTEYYSEGNWDATYLKKLVDLLNSGALPVSLKILSATKLDATIGGGALNMIVTAGLVAFIAISIFMLVYYELPGIVAVIALMLYILFTLTVLKLIDATFSLAAIAGFVLSVGMAVDANILVFERMKEEMRAGKDLHRSLDLGFRRALTAIVDSNACTILTALVLLYFGTGPVKGFATTLIIGVAISLFTAVSVTRSLLEFVTGSGYIKSTKWFGLNRQWFGESLEAGANKKPLQIVNKAGRYFLISALTIVPGIIFICLHGLKGNVEFTGGTQITYKIDNTVNPRTIEANLDKAGFEGSTVIVGSNESQRLAYVTIPPNDQVTEKTANAANIVAEKAGLQDNTSTEISTVGGQVQSETVRNAVWGVICSTVLIILYLSVRFGLAIGGFVVGMRFATSAILALIHDILVVIGLAAVMGYLLNWQVSALFISAMLTVIGFSTHDTIVIFDRIRENLHRPIQGEDVAGLINRSITQSVARSINTSMTVIATLAILIGVGSATPELKLFNLAMMVGIISGTYSSIFNASPILYLWDMAIGRKNPKKTLLGIAAQNKLIRRAPLQEVGPTKAQPATTNGQQAQQPGYSQVKRRRASDVERSKRPLNVEDDEE